MNKLFIIIRNIAALYVVVQLFFIWGFLSSRYQFFPFQLFNVIVNFVEGNDLGRKTTVFEKLSNDLNLKPERFIWNFPNSILENMHPIKIDGLTERREAPMLYMASSNKIGYRAIFGAMDFKDSFWGGILVDPKGNVVHYWKLSTDHLPNSVSPYLKNMYGVSLQPDGSVIFTMQKEGGGIVKVNACSDIEWNIKGHYHHAISPTENETFWTFAGEQGALDPELAEISIATGEILRQIDMKKVRKTNSSLHIFNLQRNPNQFDATHGNDIDPLSAALAPKFVQFESGDLLISYRTTNTIFVLDPDTLAVKWWRTGPWSRQHDPDWEPDGTIKVFSNNQVGMRSGISDIISIDPKSYQYTKAVDGSLYNFYSSINGLHQLTNINTRLITSTTQGWAFEVDKNNQIVFSFVNLYDAEASEALNISAAYFYDENYFDSEFWKQCK